MNDEHLRQQALSVLKAKASFWRYIGVWIGVSVLMLGIWLLTTPSGYFWPAWPILGMGIAVPILGFAAFRRGAGGPTESQIQAEMKRLSTGGQHRQLPREKI